MLKRKNVALDALLAGILFVTVLLILMLSSCKHEPDVLPQAPANETGNGNGNGNSGNGGNNGSGNGEECDPNVVYFQTQVLPLLISNCAKSGCHDAASHQDGVVLTDYANIMATADVRPGRADNSDLYEVITENDPDDRMPPGPAAPLSNSQINLIFNWIEQGAINNTCTNACDTTSVTFSGTIQPIIQNNCIGCHSGPAAGGQIDLSNHQNVKAAAISGKLYGAVNHQSGYSFMPKGGNKLPECLVRQIRIWIEGGMLNN